MAEEQTETKRGRKPNTPNLEAVTKAIERGAYDDDLELLSTSISVRRDVLKEHVMERVRQVFGPDVEVVSTKPRGLVSAIEEQSRMKNLFEQKARKYTRTVPEDETLSESEDDEDRITPDALSQSEGGSTEMIEPPIERRGAEISGMHSSDMGG